MNKLKQRLQAGETLHGLFVVSNSLQNAEALSHSGFDFLCFDVEHSPSAVPAVHAQLAALGAAGTPAMVRVTGLDPVVFKHYLDLGAGALMVPNINTAEQARTAVRYARYPVAGGVRGVGGTMRVNRYGRDKGYFAQAADSTCVVLQAETREALGNLEEICAVEGVDVIFFGPADLAADMGYMGQPTHPEVVAAIEDGMRRARAAGVATGVAAGDPECRRYVEAGARMVILGSDLALLVRAADTLAAKYCGDAAQ
jgi:4-hydroxy-2-oxoheptanedioate aldolase